jgi:hypothetical protein
MHHMKFFVSLLTLALPFGNGFVAPARWPRSQSKGQSNQIHDIRVGVRLFDPSLILVDKVRPKRLDDHWNRILEAGTCIFNSISSRRTSIDRTPNKIEAKLKIDKPELKAIAWEYLCWIGRESFSRESFSRELFSLNCIVLSDDDGSFVFAGSGSHDGV